MVSITFYEGYDEDKEYGDYYDYDYEDYDEEDYTENEEDYGEEVYMNFLVSAVLDSNITSRLTPQFNGSFLRSQLLIANYHVKKFVRKSQ